MFNLNETVSVGAASATAGNNRTIASAYDNDNRAVIVGTIDGGTDRSKVQQFYTMLDNERQQQFNLVCADYDDYMLLKEKLTGSVIQGADMFYYNWFRLEDFSSISERRDNSENLEVGLDLSIERKWDFFALQLNTAPNPAIVDTVVLELLMAQMLTVGIIITTHMPLLKSF